MRRKSVAFFLGDVGFLADPKFRALSRRLPDADDFNSAVGAYWIALAASRRNGSLVLDAEEETQSRYIEDLEEVGLLPFEEKSWNEWAAQAPQVVAGKARAEKAKRDEHGHFTSVSSALDPAGALDQPSPPLPSNQLTNGKGVVKGENDDLWRLYTGLTGGARIKPSVLQWLTELETTHGAQATAAALRAEHAEDSHLGTLLSRTRDRLEHRPSKGDRILDRMLERRMAWYRESGEWDPEWGPVPESVAS